MKTLKSSWLTLTGLGALAALAGLVPLVRACYLVEVSYNEGWNVYNAQTVAQGGLLYPVRYGWTTVNYPMLSFWLMAQLHRLTHEYLFTARVVSVLSLVITAWLAGVAARAVGSSRRSAVLAGLFCWTALCATAPSYVGADDPQLLGQAILMAGLAVYVSAPRSLGRVSGAALLFALGLFVKHNQVDFPLAVFLDLCFTALPLAAWFTTVLLACAALGTLFCIRYGGAFFFAQLLTPRTYSWEKAGLQMLDAVGPLLPVFAIAIYTGWKRRRDPRGRVLGLLLLTSVLIGGYFSGGGGVGVNALFSVLVSLAMLLALFLDDICCGNGPRWMAGLAPYAPWLCFCWLLIPLGRSGNWNPSARLREVRQAQARFEADVAVLRGLPGPAICESLLECYEAGKPYVYDPFNATRLIQFGKLNSETMVAALRQGTIGAVQANGPLAQVNEQQQERFASEIRAAVACRYVPVQQRGPEPNLDWGPAQASVIYAPRPGPHPGCP